MFISLRYLGIRKSLPTPRVYLRYIPLFYGTFGRGGDTHSYFVGRRKFIPGVNLARVDPYAQHWAWHAAKRIAYYPFNGDGRLVLK